MLVYLVLFSAAATSLSLRLPVVEVLTVASKNLRTIDFIEKSYQPLLISGALKRDTVVSLWPWTFPALDTSLEAATTFCVAFPRYEEGREDRKEVYKVGKTDEDNLRYFNKDGTQMSLRRFFMEGEGRWDHAYTSITKDIGSAVVLPKFLHDADLTFVDLTKTGLHHGRVGWEDGVSGRGATGSATVVCVVEGHLSLILTPFPHPWRLLQCTEEECQMPTPLQEAETHTYDQDYNHIHTDDHTQTFVVRASVLPRACLYNPPGWQWSAVATEDTTYLWVAWEDDLVIQEDVIDRLFPADEKLGSEVDGNEEFSVGKHGFHKREGLATHKVRRRRRPMTLWEALPRSLERPLLLWGAQTPLLHLVRRYLLSDLSLNLQAFLDQFRIDRTLLPDLVDCPEECLSVVSTVFTLLDTDTDGVLTARDTNFLTQDTFISLTHHLDDLVDELKDLARDQWIDVLEGLPETRQAFLDRAKERLAASAGDSVKRWVAGDLEGVDEAALKEHLPDIHAQVLAAREAALSTSSPGAREAALSTSSPGAREAALSTSSPGAREAALSTSSPGPREAALSTSSPGAREAALSTSSPGAREAALSTSSPGAREAALSTSSPGAREAALSTSSPGAREAALSTSSPGAREAALSTSSPGKEDL